MPPTRPPPHVELPPGRPCFISSVLYPSFSFIAMHENLSWLIAQFFWEHWNVSNVTDRTSLIRDRKASWTPPQPSTSYSIPLPLNTSSSTPTDGGAVNSLTRPFIFTPFSF